MDVDSRHGGIGGEDVARVCGRAETAAEGREQGGGAMGTWDGVAGMGDVVTEYARDSAGARSAGEGGRMVEGIMRGPGIPDLEAAR